MDSRPSNEGGKKGVMLKLVFAFDLIHSQAALTASSKSKSKKAEAPNAQPSGEDDGSDTDSTGPSFMVQVRQRYPCVLHKEGLPCYPTSAGCVRFTAAQLAQYRLLVVSYMMFVLRQYTH